MVYKQTKLRNWIEPSKIQWFLSYNSNAIEFLKENPEKIDWSQLSSNIDRKSTRLNSSHTSVSLLSRMPSSA
jgi:ribosomal protein L24E